MDLKIPVKSNDETLNVALDTIDIGKQALIFVNTKRSAEKVAEDIARFLEKNNEKKNEELANNILHALSKPTKQCERLHGVIKQGVAFHHAGLTNKQKELIEDNFRSGAVKIICCTPTLAAGVDLPAYRTIIRDLKRFSVRGYVNIPVLEYLQMSGRAGRPKYDKEGQSIIITSTESEKEAVTERYVNGEPEDITSKLAVEPALRTYILSLVASEFVNSKEKLTEFFSKTFWAHQFEDMKKLNKIISRMIRMLEEFKFIESKEDCFVSADEIKDEKLTATGLGKRAAQLYIDPVTAHDFISGMGRCEKPGTFALLQMISNTLEIRPQLTVKSREYDHYANVLAEKTGELITPEPSEFEPEFDSFFNSIKTASFFNEWIEEKDDDYLLERYDVRPGESRAKLETANWLLYAAHELAKLCGKPLFAKETMKLKFRLKYGVKEELLPLLRLREIGRVRGRKLFNNGIKNLGDVKKADFTALKQLLGEKTAKAVKEQVGQ